MKEIRLVSAINEALAEEMSRDEKVYIIGEDVQAGTFGATTRLIDKFGPDRVMDTPLSETAIAGAAVGSAMTGYRPVADFMFSDFMFIAGDEIFVKAAKWRFIHGGTQQLPLVFMATMGGYAKLGAEHSQSPESMFMHTPGLKLVVPSTPYDAKGLMKSAIRDNNPVVYLYHKGLLGLKGEIPEEEYIIPLGQADIKREGTDVTVVATGMQVHFTLRVAQELEGKASLEVIDPRSLEPLDIETIIESVKKTGRVVVVDEDTKRCGVAAEIMAQIMEQAFDYLDAPIQRVAAANYPIPGGFMEDHVLPQIKHIKTAVETVMG
ncbi:MAG: alpha-ketoacid dehydrogenase subunit beta [Deltaproteobacteria bacterium]|nr:alpha-ketoacid dehydrogenase subunit beta [Deltaproteobacteria bacterium]MBW2085039.1 alpha-ketoacid dehydrogenase subunit beta [Deltaproteobacteria bacterium]